MRAFTSSTPMSDTSAKNGAPSPSARPPSTTTPSVAQANTSSRASDHGSQSTTSSPTTAKPTSWSSSTPSKSTATRTLAPRSPCTRDSSAPARLLTFSQTSRSRNSRISYRCSRPRHKATLYRRHLRHRLQADRQCHIPSRHRPGRTRIRRSISTDCLRYRRLRAPRLRVIRALHHRRHRLVHQRGRRRVLTLELSLMLNRS